MVLLQPFQRLRSLVLIFGLLQAPTAGAALAAEVGGVNVPETFVVDRQTLHLNGAGLRQVPILGIGIYVAALYLPVPSHDASAIAALPGPKAIILHFLHDASKAQVEGQFRKGERINCGDGECSKSDLPDFEHLVMSSPAVSVGDTSTYIYEPKRLRVLANGNLIGDYADADLSSQLLKGFIGPHPPTEALKRALLGLQ
jgi:hypothetical protein